MHNTFCYWDHYYIHELRSVAPKKSNHDLLCYCINVMSMRFSTILPLEISSDALPNVSLSTLRFRINKVGNVYFFMIFADPPPQLINFSKFQEGS